MHLSFRGSGSICRGVPTKARLPGAYLYLGLSVENQLPLESEPVVSHGKVGLPWALYLAAKSRTVPPCAVPHCPDVYPAAGLDLRFFYVAGLPGWTGFPLDKDLSAGR